MKSNILGMPLAQAISLFTFLLAIISIWVHMEIRLAELNVEITNLKQDLLLHKTDNTRNFDIIRSDTLYIRGKCNADTIIIHRTVPVEKIKIVKPDKVDQLISKIPWLISGLIFIILLMALLVFKFKN